MNQILVELNRRAKETEEVSLASKLCLLADWVIKTAQEHQKRVIQVMPEFDLHDEVHLAKVLENIACLIGEERVKTLSVVELFLLIASAYLHDCGMAPAEWELKLMQLTEGTDSFFECENSIRNDGKASFTFSQARSFVANNKREIYGKYEGDVQGWQFSENNETALIDALAGLLIDYQTFRNGFASELNACDLSSTFKELNKGIRIDYIRSKHPFTSYRYILNASPKFHSFIGESWSDKMVKDLALACQAHGEDIAFVKDQLSPDSRYCPNEKANLQFIAMMLRMGDICHYSFDRAPLIIRNAKVFQSDYSYREWAVKDAAVNYEIKDCIIKYYAYCDTPEKYYKLHGYLDWIDEEINSFCDIQRRWNIDYQLSIHDVDREGVSYDDTKFKPVRGKQFTLQQKKIIQLLMGVGLYKDPYASLRELYQNAMDACKCMQHKEQSFGRNYHGQIEFGLETDGSNQFLYCSDNGVGMTEGIIENYLLKIGNSYYKSSDFYREQAVWSTDFVPTSQFGIGILSCFMIADRIEIITKTSEAKDVLTCCIDGPQEFLYYRMPSGVEKERIGLSGTVVKLSLKPEYAATINSSHIEKLGLVLQYDLDRARYDKFATYKDLYDNWNESIYKRINSFIVKTPDNIDVVCRCDDGKILPIFDKPFALKVGELGITEADRAFISKLMPSFFFSKDENALVDIHDYFQHYNIHVEVPGIEYDLLMDLPLSIIHTFDNESHFFELSKVTGDSVAIDGIGVDKDYSLLDDLYYNLLIQSGTINYTGTLRPQLSVDRHSIVEFPNIDTSVYQQIVIKAIHDLVTIAQQHIKKYDLSANASLVKIIWHYVFRSMNNADVLFVNYLADSDLGGFMWPGLTSTLKKDMTISDFMKSDTQEIIGYDYHRYDKLTSYLIIAKMLTADEISIDKDNNVKMHSTSFGRLPESDRYYNRHMYVVPAPNECECFNEYDIVSSLYPLVPERLIRSLRKSDGINQKIKGTEAYRIEAFGNSFAALFNQDARLVHPIHGLYTLEKHFGRKPDTYINSFETRRKSLRFIDLGYDGESGNKGMMLLAFIAPRQLTAKDREEIEKYKDSIPGYYNGVMEGWTLLVTAMDIDNVVVLPGKRTRQEMLDKLSPEFWNEYKDYEFRFLDGRVVTSPNAMRVDR
jgi:hypothetical protein